MFERTSNSYPNEARHNYPGKPILKWAYYPGNLFSNGPSIQKCYSHTGMHTGIRAYYDIPKDFENRTKIRI